MNKIKSLIYKQHLKWLMLTKLKIHILTLKNNYLSVDLLSYFKIFIFNINNYVLIKIPKTTFYCNWNKSGGNIFARWSFNFRIEQLTIIFVKYPFITFWLECVATTPFNVVATHSNQKVIKVYVKNHNKTLL